MTGYAAAKLDRGMIAPENRLILAEWNSGDQMWFVDLIAPIVAEQNRQRAIMIADLISKPLKGIVFRFHQTDPAAGKRTVQIVVAYAGEKLAELIKAAVKQDDGTRH